MLHVLVFVKENTALVLIAIVCIVVVIALLIIVSLVTYAVVVRRKPTNRLQSIHIINIIMFQLYGDSYLYNIFHSIVCFAFFF